MGYSVCSENEGVPYYDSDSRSRLHPGLFLQDVSDIELVWKHGKSAFQSTSLYAKQTGQFSSSPQVNLLPHTVERYAVSEEVQLREIAPVLF